MVNLQGFNADNFENESPSFLPIPAGWYEAIIIDSEMKETKSGTGEYLQLTLEIVGPTQEGRKLWDRLNLKNQNQVAVDIANRTLADICRAVGVHAPKTSEELHDRPLMVKVAHREYQGETREEVKGYKPAAKAGNGQHSTAKQGDNLPPWQRKG